MGLWVAWVKLWSGWHGGHSSIKFWRGWRGSKLAWVVWVHKIGVGRNFGIGRNNGLCRNKMELVKINIFQVFMVCMSCYFIIFYRNYYVLCRLSGPAEAGPPVFKDSQKCPFKLIFMFILFLLS